MKRFVIISTVIFGIFILDLFHGCKTGGVDSGENPVPVLTSLSPSSAVSHMPPFTLTAYGANFVAGSTILVNGVAKETAFVGVGELTCRINQGDTLGNTPASMTGVPVQPGNKVTSLANWDMPVLVRSPSPGGGDSRTLAFTVNGNHTFNDPAAVTSDAGGRSSLPRVVLDAGGNIMVVYEFWDGLSDPGGIRFIRSPDGGGTWEGPLNVGDCFGGCENPGIAVDTAGNPKVVFSAGDRVCFVSSMDGGVTWGDPAYLSAAAMNGVEPVIAVDAGGGLNIVWVHGEGNIDYRVYFIRSVDDGITWSTAVNIFSGWENSVSAYNVSMAVDGIGGVYAAWTSWPLGGSRYSFVYSNYSHDHGVTWNDEDSYFGVCNRSGLAVDNEGNLDIVLESATLPFMYDVRFRKSMDRGVTWEPVVAVTSNAYISRPKMAIDSVGNINVIYRSGGVFNFTRSIDGGALWSEGFPITGNANSADIGVDARGTVYVVWGNEDTGQLDITVSSL